MISFDRFRAAISAEIVKREEKSDPTAQDLAELVDLHELLAGLPPVGTSG